MTLIRFLQKFWFASNSLSGLLKNLTNPIIELAWSCLLRVKFMKIVCFSFFLQYNFLQNDFMANRTERWKHELIVIWWCCLAYLDNLKQQFGGHLCMRKCTAKSVIFIFFQSWAGWCTWCIVLFWRAVRLGPKSSTATVVLCCKSMPA